MKNRRTNQAFPLSVCAREVLGELYLVRSCSLFDIETVFMIP